MAKLVFTVDVSKIIDGVEQPGVTYTMHASSKQKLIDYLTTIFPDTKWQFKILNL